MFTCENGEIFCLNDAVSVAMAPWTREHRVFVVENYIKSGESVIAVQRLFRKQFNVERRGNIPDRNTILRWVDAFRTTGTERFHSPGNRYCGGRNVGKSNAEFRGEAARVRTEGRASLDGRYVSEVIQKCSTKTAL